MKYIISFITTVIVLFVLGIAIQFWIESKIKEKTVRVCNSVLYGDEEAKIIEMAKRSGPNHWIRKESEEYGEQIVIIFSGTTFLHGVCTITLKEKKAVKSEVSYTD